METDPHVLGTQFGKCVILQVTAQCPLECAHCIVQSGPDRQEQFSTEDLTALIGQIATDGRAELVIFTGGEPFLKRGRLVAALEAVAAHGLNAAIVTSGSWASSPRSAERTLAALPIDAIADLAFSADRHHLPFLALDHVKNGLEAAVALGIPASVFICLDGPSDDFAERIRDHLGAGLYGNIRKRITQTHRAGRAATRPDLAHLADPVPFEDLPDQPCPAPATPAVCPDGRVMACCGDTMADPHAWQALELGWVGRDGFGDLLDRADTDLLIQALRVFGPKHLARVAMQAGALDCSSADRRNICDICRKAVTDARALAAITAWLKRADVQTGLMARRLLAYGEMARTGSGAA